MIDPGKATVRRTLLAGRRREVLTAAGLPNGCPRCERPSGPELPVRGRAGFAFCPEACSEAEWERIRQHLWTPGSGRRP